MARIVMMAVVVVVVLLVSINSVNCRRLLAEEQLTVGQRLDSAVAGATNTLNEHGGPEAVNFVSSVVNFVSSVVKFVYGMTVWFCDKAREWGNHF